MNIMQKRLAELRGNRSQGMVAEYASIPQTTLSGWERRTALALENLKKLACYYQVSTDYLLGLTDDPRPTATTAHHKITDEQAALLELFEQLDEEERHYVMGLLTFVKSRNTPRIIGEE